MSLVSLGQQAVVSAPSPVLPPPAAAAGKTEGVDGRLGTVLYQLVELSPVMFAAGRQRFAGGVAGCHRPLEAQRD